MKSFYRFSSTLFFSDTPVVLVQLVENPPWIKRDKGKLLEAGCLNLTPISEKKMVKPKLFNYFVET